MPIYSPAKLHTMLAPVHMDCNGSATRDFNSSSRVICVSMVDETENLNAELIPWNSLGFFLVVIKVLKNNS